MARAQLACASNTTIIMVYSNPRALQQLLVLRTSQSRLRLTLFQSHRPCLERCYQLVNTWLLEKRKRTQWSAVEEHGWKSCT